MAIIENKTTPLPGDQITAEMNNAFRYLVGVYNRNMARVWTNPKYTPQQVCDQLGTNAALAFQYAGLLSTLLNTVQPGTIDISDPPAFTPNPDGTVTIPQ